MADITPEQITAVIVALTSLIAAIGAVVGAVYGKQTRLHAKDASNEAAGARSEATTARKAAIYSVSQNASIQQTITEHCGNICPSITCPLRRPEENAS